MSKSGILVFLLLFIACGNSVAKDAIKKVKPTASKVDASKLTEDQKISYALGIQVGLGMKKSFTQNGLLKVVDIELLTQGLKDSFSGRKPAMTPLQLQVVMNQYRRKMIAQQQQALIKYKKEHDAYFVKLKSTKGIVTHKSGIMYTVAVKGKGPSPKLTDTVKLHYTILTTSGKLIFSSKANRRLITIVPGRTPIKVLKVALPLMKVGSKWRIHSPASLLFGARGKPPQIKPMQALVFNIELVSINPPAAKPVAPKKK